MTREQLLALLREVSAYAGHRRSCEDGTNFYGQGCTCGFGPLMVRVEDALATERTEPTQ